MTQLATDVAASRGDRHQRRRHLFALLAVVFVVSRIAYYVAGVRFNAGAIGGAIQLLPADLLRHDLVRSLWYLHAQPPAFNAFVGVALHSPLDTRLTLELAYWAMGLALAFAIFALMVELGVSLTAAFVVSAIYIASPTVVLFENWMFYDYPVALFVVVAALCVARSCVAVAAGMPRGFATSLALLGLGRASFHVVYLAIAGAFLVLTCRAVDRRAALIAALVPVVLVGGLLVKNTVLFGEPEASTWFGMNLAHMMFRNDPPEMLADVQRGRLSRQALVVPFVGLNRYPNAVLPHTGVPALDETSNGGRVNYNNEAYIKVSNDYQHDVRVFVQDHPGFYAHRVGESFRTSFASAVDYQAFRANRPHIADLVSLESRLSGQLHGLVPVSPHDDAPKWDEIAWVIVFAYGLVIAAGSAIGWRALRRRRWGGEARYARALVFIAGTVGYMLVTSNFVELGDNMRFRFESDPLVLSALVAVVTHWWRARRSRDVAGRARPDRAGSGPRRSSRRDGRRRAPDRGLDRASGSRRSFRSPS